MKKCKGCGKGAIPLPKPSGKKKKETGKMKTVSIKAVPLFRKGN